MTTDYDRAVRTVDAALARLRNQVAALRDPAAPRAFRSERIVRLRRSPASTPSQVPTAPRGILARQSRLILGAGRTSFAGTFDGKMHGLSVSNWRFLDADAAAAHTFYAARFAP